MNGINVVAYVCGLLWVTALLIMPAIAATKATRHPVPDDCCMYCGHSLAWGNVCGPCDDMRYEPGEKWGYDSDR